MLLAFLLVWLIFDAVFGKNNTSADILMILAVLYMIVSLYFEIT